MQLTFDEKVYRMTRRGILKYLGAWLPSSFFLHFTQFSFQQSHQMTNHKNFDVIIIGGSYAGLSAAMALGRSLRKVLIIDSGLPCNRQTPHSHNFITQDGETPAAIAKKAKQQVLNYDTIQWLNDLALDGKKSNGDFVITTKSSGEFTAQKLIFSTGIKDIMPDIKGFSACWGISIVHCPYCHGYEIRGKKTAIIANGDHAFHLASLVNNLTSEITILTSGEMNFSEEQLHKLQQHQIDIIEQPITEIEHDNGHLKNIFFADGRTVQFQAAYGVVPFEQHCKIPVDLGCQLTEQGYLQTDEFQKTTIDSVFACGDNSTRMRSVANAVYGGNVAGAIVNMELTNERF